MSNDLPVSFSAQTDELNAAVDRSRSLIQQFGDKIKAVFAKIDTTQTKQAFSETADAADAAGQKIQASYSDRIGASVSGAADNFGVLGRVAKDIAETFANAATAAERLVEPIRQAAGAFDQTTESMSSVNLIAQRAGLSMQELGASFHDLQTKAESGDAGTVAALNAIGLKASDVANLSQEQLAVKLASAFSTANDSANKTAAGVALLGSTVSEKLVPQLDLGSARMNELAGLAGRVGQSFSGDFAARVQGTATQLQLAKDRIQEFNLALGNLFDDAKVGAFRDLKASIDGLLQTFSDVTKNVNDVIEYFGRLIGAGNQSAETFGLLHSAANLLATGIIEVTSRIEIFAVQAVQSLAQVGVSFEGLQKVVAAFGDDIMRIATESAGALYKAFQEAISGVIALFGDLAEAGKQALSFDLSGVSAAFGKFGNDVKGTGDKIRSALSPIGFNGTKAAIADMQNGAEAYAKSLDKVIAKLEKQKADELALIAAGGTKGTGVNQTRDVGDPSAPDKSSGNSEKLQAALRELEGEIQATKSAEKQKEELLTAGVKLKQITEDQKSEAVQKALADELSQEQAIYQKELALDGLKATQRQEILNKMAQAQQRYNNAVLKMQIEAAVRTQQTWDQAFGQIEGAVNSQINGLLRGTQTFGQAMRNVFATLLEDIIKFCTKWALSQAETVAQNILGVNAQTTAQIAGASAGTAAQTAGAAASSVAILSGIVKNITASAAETFAGIFGFLSPIMGPAAVGPAAAGQATVAAMAALPSFDVGAWSLPSDMVAQVHAGEMIVPAGPASLMRAAAGGGTAPSSSSSGDTHLHFSVSAMDGGSVRSWLANGGARLMAKAIDDHRRYNPSLQGV